MGEPVLARSSWTELALSLMYPSQPAPTSLEFNVPETLLNTLRIYFYMTPQQSYQAGPITNPNLYTLRHVLVNSSEAKQLVRGGVCRGLNPDLMVRLALLFQCTQVHTQLHTPCREREASSSMPTC